MSPEDQAKRVAARFLEGYKRPTDMVPVWNKQKERTVYVLPETIQESGGEYEPLPAKDQDSQGKPAPLRHPGQPQLPKKPRKPHKPPIDRTPPPAPLHPPVPPQDRKPLPPRKPTRVKHVKPPKVPHPPKHEDHKKVRRFVQAHDDRAHEIADRVLQKFLDAIQTRGV